MRFTWCTYDFSHELQFHTVRMAKPQYHRFFTRCNLFGEYAHFPSICFQIPWRNEPWLFIVAAFHVCIMLLSICRRAHPNFLSFILFCLLGGCLCSPWLNELAATHWRLFATDQYFDSHGFFILCVWSAPILINAMLITILLLLQVGQLLVQKKRLEWNVGARKKSEKKKS
ncbi:hypothetical protein P879_07320 [Paragonimus westermani]|uniref:Transmembrane protein 18 n=1 Tax=Paragonimus westermani TaxID=34504 RepID=A0A8T0CZG8_9TREM|nr:hypothetical protein P879_07320 [Paragonimus westermani]